MSAGLTPMLAALMAGLSALSLFWRWTAGQGGGAEMLMLAILSAGAMLTLCGLI